MDVFAKSLAPALGYPEEEVVGWLEAVFQKIAEELVLNGEVHLAELGVLQRVHIPSEPREVNGKLMLVPPRHEIKFMRKPSSENGVVFGVGVEQLQLEEEVAQKFSKGFVRVVEKVVEVRGTLQLGELGEFVRVDRDGLVFRQSPTFSDLLDKPFIGLSPVIISERREPAVAATPATPNVHQQAYTESKTTRASEPSVVPTQPAHVGMQDSYSATASVAERTLSDADASFLKSPVLSTVDEPMSFSQSKEMLFKEEDEPVSADSNVDVSGREPLFVVLSAAAKAPPESEDERDATSRKSATATEENGAPFRYEAAASSRAPYRSVIEQAPPAPVPSSTEDPSTWVDDTPEDKEAPVLRNIAIATAIVFFTVIIGFVVMKYESISFTPPAPPAPVDRAKLEAEKAAAARAEAERILAEKSIPKKPTRIDSSTIKADGTLLKNITKAAKELPSELTTIDLSKGGYTIIVASQPTRENAVAIVEEFGKLGLAAAVMEKQVGKAIRYRVRVGRFATAAEANAARKKYKSVIPFDAFLEKLSEPSL
jgi:nucleoid DNA-binding protein/flagellum-specific peptidoglycan hydrolase FlgJ